MENNPYESSALLEQYLVFHYAPEELQFPYDLPAVEASGFPRKCVSAGLDLERIAEKGRALDLGCSVGGATFELAKHFREVVGIDSSQTFVDAANLLKQEGKRSATLSVEGSRVRRIEVQVDEAIERGRVSFERGDVQELRSDLGQFDAVIACNLICRLSRPRALLEGLPHLVKPGGQLFLTTPFSWLEEYTPRENWLGEEEQDSFDALQAELESSFSLDKCFDLPFLIREHARKFQYGVALASRWTRK
jgi:putative 4-mercaptohistidine N1-methyltranferase